MLTRKHFREAAHLIGQLNPDATLSRESVASLVAIFFKQENPRFDEAAFLQAILKASPSTPDAVVLDVWARLREEHGTDLR